MKRNAVVAIRSVGGYEDHNCEMLFGKLDAAELQQASMQKHQQSELDVGKRVLVSSRRSNLWTSAQQSLMPLSYRIGLVPSLRSGSVVDQ